jgi:hypothetical protein
MKKRVEFIATATDFFPHEEDLILTFYGDDESLLELFREGDSIFAELYPSVQRLSLCGAQLIGRLDWLYLDFHQQDYLHRIGVYVGSLDHSELARDMQELTDGSDVKFSHIQIKTNQGEQAVASDGDKPPN